jgi:hypothetical protein
MPDESTQTNASFFEFMNRLEEREAEHSWRTDFGESYMADLANRPEYIADHEFFAKHQNLVDFERERSEVSGQEVLPIDKQEQTVQESVV